MKVSSNKRDSFILYKSHFVPISTLTDEQLGRLFRAVYRWQIEGEAEPEPDIAMAFGFLVNQFRIDNKRYDARCTVNRESARRRWEMRTDANACESIQTDAKDADNDNDYDNDKDKDKSSDHIIDNWRQLSSAKLDQLRITGQQVADFKRSLLLQEINDVATELGLTQSDIEAFMQKWGESSPGSDKIRAEYEATFNVKERAKNYKGVGRKNAKIEYSDGVYSGNSEGK